MDGAEVVVGVGATFGEGDDVVDLIGERFVADVADAGVLVEDAAAAAVLLCGGECGAELLAALLRSGPGGGGVVVAWAEVGAAWCAAG